MLAYGYCRYSSDIQSEKSIEQQKMELEEYAKRNGINIIKYYCDEAQSGRSDTRENFQQLINDACKLKKVQAVLVWKTDRFARKAMDSLYYRTKLEKCNIKLLSISQPIDIETPEGKLMSTMLAGMDEYFSQNLASNVKRALKNNAHNCQFNGGIPPLGYNIVDKKYVINEQEAKIVKEIYNMYIDGMSYIDIALNLNMRGYKTKKNQKFAKTSVMSILTNEKYTGKYIFNKGTKHNHSGIREDAIIYENAIPVIISKEVFDKAMSRKRTKKNAENTAKRIYLLSGLIHCSCGGTYTGRTARTKKANGKVYEQGYYTCSNHNKLGNCNFPSLKQNLLENKIVDIITNELLDKTNMQKIVNEVNLQLRILQDESTEDVLELKKKIKELEIQINNVVDMVCKGIATEAMVLKSKELEDLKKNLEEELEFKEHASNITIDKDEIIRILKKDISNLENSSKTNTKNLIRKWVKKIEVTTTEVIVHFNLRRLFTSKDGSEKWIRTIDLPGMNRML